MRYNNEIDKRLKWKFELIFGVGLYPIDFLIIDMTSCLMCFFNGKCANDCIALHSEFTWKPLITKLGDIFQKYYVDYIPVWEVVGVRSVVISTAGASFVVGSMK